MLGYYIMPSTFMAENRLVFSGKGPKNHVDQFFFVWFMYRKSLFKMYSYYGNAIIIGMAL